MRMQRSGSGNDRPVSSAALHSRRSGRPDAATANPPQCATIKATRKPPPRVTVATKVDGKTISGLLVGARP